MFKMHCYGAIFSLFLILATFGCDSIKDLTFKKGENFKTYSASSAQVLKVIKSLIVNSGEKLSEEDNNIVLNSPPEVSYYKIAGDYGQYSWSWKIANKKKIIVSGTGSLSDLTTSSTWLDILITGN